MSEQRKSDLSQIQVTKVPERPKEPNPCPDCGHDMGYYISWNRNAAVPFTRCDNCARIAEKQKKAAEEAAFKTYVAENILDILIRCGVPGKYRRIQIEPPAGEILESCQQVIDGRSVIIYGKSGRGKFTLAVYILRAILLTGRHAMGDVLLTTVENLCRHIREGIGNDGHDARLYKAAGTRMVVLDNLGEEKATPNNINIVREIIKNRYDNQLHTIITTRMRMSTGELAERYGDDLASVIKPMLVITLTGPDRRAGEVW